MYHVMSAGVRMRTWEIAVSIPYVVHPVLTEASVLGPACAFVKTGGKETDVKRQCVIFLA